MHRDLATDPPFANPFDGVHDELEHAPEHELQDARMVGLPHAALMQQRTCQRIAMYAGYDSSDPEILRALAEARDDARRTVGRQRASGSVKEKRVPSPNLLSTEMWPP